MPIYRRAASPRSCGPPAPRSGGRFLRRAAALALLPVLAFGAEREPPCPGVVFTGAKVKLTAVERRLACGDPESEAWKQVPRDEARRFLSAFYQQRGYLHPVFRYEGERLFADPGRLTKIRILGGDDFPAGIDLSKRRLILGAPLTPAALDDVSAALAGELQNRGYPCPEVTMSANARTGEVRAAFRGGVIHAAEPIEEPVLDGIDSGIFRRFEAFKRERPLDLRLLTITSARIVDQALFLNSSYDVSCGTEGVRIVHRVASAPPRLVGIGLGVDTEGLVSVRAHWIHSRIGKRADTSEATLFASTREQSADALMRLYPRPASRAYLLPHAYAARSDEPQYRTLSAGLSLAPGLTWDGRSAHAEFNAGPALEYADTDRGVGPQRSIYQTFDTHLTVMSHLFEFYLRDPREGFTARLDTSSRLRGVDSSLTANRVRLSTEKLWNVGGFEPPLAVLGERNWAGTTMVADPAAALARLPPAMRFFIGGDADYRGVGPGQLGDQGGFLTGVYQGLELRAGRLLPYQLQPFTFLDAAMGGRSPLHLDPDVSLAPGFGTRWATFIGAFRVSVARHFVWRRDPGTLPPRPHWQFFFSYGREF